MTTINPVGKKVFLVGSQQVRVRADAGLKGAMIRWIDPGTQLEVDPASRREADGYVWWKHAEGWSAERGLDGKFVYMTEVVVASTPAPVAPAETTTPTEPAPAVTEQPTVVAVEVQVAVVEVVTPPVTVIEPPKKKVLQVGPQQVRVRGDAGLAGVMIRWIDPGTLLEVDPESRRELDGFIWWKHSEGWSAERNSAGSQIFLVDPSVDVSSQVSSAKTGSGGPDQNTLPLVGGLFKRLPVDLNQTQWWQYFGNNVFAYNLWRDGKNWYRYAQSLHGGVDFGNSVAGGVPVYAGVSGGKFIKLDTQYTQPNGLWVKVGDYTIIYGHLINPRPFKPGDPIDVNTVLGEIQLHGQQHLHLEMRYRDAWLVNPLMYFGKDMQDAILKKFPPSSKYFYSDANWNQWTTPYDQPLLKLGGPVIGPHGPR